jgi:hypothetical protein
MSVLRDLPRAESPGFFEEACSITKSCAMKPLTRVEKGSRKIVDYPSESRRENWAVVHGDINGRIEDTRAGL